MYGSGALDSQSRRLTALALALGLTAAAYAQEDEPPPIPAELRSAQQLDEAQKKQVQAFVDGWFKKLKTGDRREVALAQEELTRLVEGQPGPSAGFRQGYATVIAPAI